MQRHHECNSGYPFMGIGFMLAGSAVFTPVTGNTVSVREGDLIFIPKGTVYYSDWAGHPDIAFITVSVDFSAEPSLAYKYKLQKKQGMKEQFDLISSCYDLVSSEDPENYHRALGYFYSLVDGLFDGLEPKTVTSSMNAISPALQHIESHYNDEIKIDTLCELCHLSPSALYTYFNALVGYPPIEYRNRLRIRKAVEMLSTNEYSIQEISDELSFSSPSYFRRVFKKYTGHTPKRMSQHTFSI